MLAGADNRSQIASVQSVTSSPPTALEIPPQPEKPVASANGISVGIHLTEPVLFVQGFEQGDSYPRNAAMLRGRLHLRITKSAKIKSVYLKLRGKGVTRWPEGMPIDKSKTEETQDLFNHTWPMFDARFSTAENETGASEISLFKPPASPTVELVQPKGRSSFDVRRTSSPLSSTTNFSLTDRNAHKRLSLQVNQSRSFGKDEPMPGKQPVMQKGYRTYQPGDYFWDFEMPMDSHLPETIDVELGYVKYWLEAVVERAGAFRANLTGSKDVTLVRVPGEGSLEQVEPIAISRNWEDQLHYDIVISGKSFPLGSKVPIAFKLTPLAKVQCHRVKVFITETIEYWAKDRKVRRCTESRKVQLYERRADGSEYTAFPGSSMQIVTGGGLDRNRREAAARGEPVIPDDPTNMLGDLRADNRIGPTEMEMNVQLPSCAAMREKDKSQRLHFDTTYANIQVHHWIKIVMRLSKQDKDDPTKRRHFEISIDSPFHILSCKATQANIALPAYDSSSSPQDSSPLSLYECGCPGAPLRRHSPTNFVPTLNALAALDAPLYSPLRQRPTDPTISPDLPRPVQAHIPGPSNPALQRPIHMLRAPSFNPPQFEDDEPPPPLETPPPLYDSIASPTSGLADYFSRLADAYDEVDSDEDRRGVGRVNVPLTPGSRVNRSMDERRTWVPVGAEGR